MTSDIQKICADMIFTDAVQDTSRLTGKSIDCVRSEFIASGAYAALYDYRTDLWQMGPDYFVGFHESLLAR